MFSFARRLCQLLEPILLGMAPDAILLGLHRGLAGIYIYTYIYILCDYIAHDLERRDLGDLRWTTSMLPGALSLGLRAMYSPIGLKISVFTFMLHLHLQSYF